MHSVEDTSNQLSVKQSLLKIGYIDDVHSLVTAGSGSPIHLHINANIPLLHGSLNALNSVSESLDLDLDLGQVVWAGLDRLVGQFHKVELNWEFHPRLSV